MSANTSLAIRIATIFDNKGFKKAETATEKLSAGVGKLAKAFASALGSKIGKLAKDSIKAFAEEERSVAMLSNALGNLGMAKQADEIYAFIDSLQMATGVSDDFLRPAFQRLATAGLNAADAQSVLALALDVSAGSGKDLNTVSAALSKAVGGNTAALSKLGVGLTKDELKTMSLNDILLKLADTYKNSAAKAAETFSGKMAKLNVAIDTAKESIGKGLIDGLMVATGSASIEDLQVKIINLGNFLAAVFVATGNLIGDNIFFIKQLGIALVAIFTSVAVYAGVAALISVINKLKAAFIALRAVGFAAAVATAAAINPVAGIAAAAALVGAITLGNIALDKFNKSKEEASKPFKAPDFTGLTAPDIAEAKRLEALKIKAAKAQEKAAKESIRLQKLSKIFDLSYIQIYAALQGKLTDEETTRVRLQLALLDENVGAADYLSKKLAESQGQTSMLSQFLRTLPDAKNPFASWGEYLKAIELEAKRIGALTFNAPGGILDYTLQSLGITSFAEGQKVTAQPGFTDAQNELLDALNSATAAQAGLTKIEVYLDGDVVGGAVTNSQINSSLSGSFNQINRSGNVGAVAIQ